MKARHNTRRERRYLQGTRVRLDAPGYPFHGATGTVAVDMLRSDGAVEVLRDGFGLRRRGLCTLASEEVARLRDQTPNPEHVNMPKGYWWAGQ